MIVLSAVSQKEQDRHCAASLTCGDLNMTEIDLAVKQEQNHSRREQTRVRKARWWGRGRNGVRGPGEQMQTVVYGMD